MKIVCLDIGGSGVKIGKFDNDRNSLKLEDIQFLEMKRIDKLNHILKELIDNDIRAIGISCAGIIDYTREVIELSRVTGWENYDIISEFKQTFKVNDVYLLNDADSHLFASYGKYDGSVMSLCLGTSPGFAICDKDWNILSALDNRNFDIGEVKIVTTAKQNEVWYAIGSKGFEDLKSKYGSDGLKRYGYRVGAFLATLSSVFKPYNIVLSGGIIEKYWSELEAPVNNEFKSGKPVWLRMPTIQSSEYGINSGLYGIAKFVAKKLKEK